MSAAPSSDQSWWRPSAHRIILAFILTVALAVRLWFLSTGIPHAVGIDEPAIVDRALAILNTGSWNTHAFDYPSLVIYVHALVAIGRFLVGATRGEWASLAEFDVGAVFLAGRFATALIGTATVWMTWRVGRLLHSPALGLTAAAQLAVLSLHVREWHFILTDVPVSGAQRPRVCGSRCARRSSTPLPRSRGRALPSV